MNGVVVDLMFVLNALAQQCGLARVLGTSRLTALTLFLVLARVAHQGSELVKKIAKAVFYSPSSRKPDHWHGGNNLH